MKKEAVNLFEIRKKGIEALNRELGPIGMIRFLQQYESGIGDYTKERHKWLDKITIEDIAGKTRNKRKERVNLRNIKKKRKIF